MDNLLGDGDTFDESLGKIIKKVIEIDGDEANNMNEF